MIGRKLLASVGLVLACLLIGHFALNAAGVGKTVLEKAPKQKVAKTDPKIQQERARGLEAKRTAPATVVQKAPTTAPNDGEHARLRKANEIIAREAGYDWFLVAEMSDRDLELLIREIQSRPTAVSEKAEPAKAKPSPAEMSSDEIKVAEMRELLMNAEAEKRAIEAAQAAEAAKKDSPPPPVEKSSAPVGFTSDRGADEIRLEKERMKHLMGASSGDGQGTALLGEEADAPREAPGQNTEDVVKDLAAAMEAGWPMTEFEKDAAYAYIAVHPESFENRGSDRSLDNVGGPDGGGYRYVDNVAPDTLPEAYSWIELDGDPLALWINTWSSASYDGAYKYIPIGFTFPFYGGMYDSVGVGIDGYLMFTNTTVDYTNTDLPTADFSGPMIFGYWDDLHLQRGGVTSGTNVVGYRNFGTYTVIQYDSIGHYDCTGNALVFEVILYNDGKIKLQYRINNIPNACDSSATVGIQKSSSGPALRYCYNTTGPWPAAGRGVLFYPTYYQTDFTCASISSPGTSEAPNAVVPVTARFMNVGTTASTCPVAYRFNAGSVVTGTTNNTLSQWQYEDYTFATSITMPGTNGTYLLEVWSDLANDSMRGNDTLKRNITVFLGDDCNSAILLSSTAGPDSTQFNNTGASDNTPGHYCYSGTSYKDMAFKYALDPGYQIEIWNRQGTLTDGKYSAKWGGTCPGTTAIQCKDPENFRMRWVNGTGVTDTVWYVAGSYGSTSSGTFYVGWKRTQCDAVSIPLSAGFEGTTTPYLPDCWGFVNADNNTYTWESYSSNYRTGTRCASMGGVGTAGNNDWLTTPPLQLTGGIEYLVEFWVRGYSASYPESLRVAWGGSNAPSGLTNILSNESIATTTYQQKSVLFTPPTTGTYYVGWQSLSNTSSSNRLYVDDVSITLSGSCVAPDTVYVNSVTAADSVILTCNANGGSGGPTQYQWFTGDGCVNGNQIAGETNQTYKTFTSGTFSCRAWKVDSVSCSKCDSAIATVIPCSAGQTVPWSTGFEDAVVPAFPLCFNVENVGGQNPTWVTSTSYPRAGGTKHAYIGYDYTYPLNDWFFIPGLQLTTGTNYILGYYYRAYGSLAEKMEVMIGTAPNSASMTQPIRSEFTFNQTTYLLDEISFSVGSPGVYYIGFHATSIANQWFIAVDDISVILEGTCTPPDTVWVNSVTAADSVILTCNASGGSGGTTQYQWFTGTDCVNGNQIAGETSSTYKTFTSGTFSCRAWKLDSVNCAKCDSAIATVISCGPGFAIPWSDGFETAAVPALAPCWSQVNVGSQSPEWVTSTTYPYSGAKSAYISYGGYSYALNDWLFSPALQLNSGTTYAVEYWYRASSASYTEKMELKLGDGATPDSMDVTLHSEFSFNQTTYQYDRQTFTVPTTGLYYIGWHGTTPSGTYGGIYMDDAMVYVDGTCSAPTVVVNDTTGDYVITFRAYASGGSGGPVQYQWYTGAGCTGGSEISGETNSTYTTATPGTYSCRAHRVDSVNCANCDAGSGTLNCTSPFSPPITEGFEGLITPNLPMCWTAQDVNTDTRTWVSSESYSRTDSTSAFCTWSSSGTFPVDDWMYSKALQLTADSSYRVDYWFRQAIGSTSWVESLEVKYGPSPTSTQMLYTIDPMFSFTNQSAWVQHSVVLTPTVTGTYHIGWHCASGIDQGGVAIDDIQIYSASGCGIPDSVRVADASAIGAVTLTCNIYGGYGGPAEYQWYTGGTCEAGNEISGATSQNYLTLTSGTFSCKGYRSDPNTCGLCDSAVATILADTCATQTIPYSYGFESASYPDLGECWRIQNVNGDYYEWKSSSSYYRTGTYGAFLDYGYSYGADDWMYSPPLQLTGSTTYRVDYFIRQAYTSETDVESLEVKFGVAPNNALMAATIEPMYAFQGTDWVEHSVTFTPATSDTYYVGWHGASAAAQSGMAADDILIYVDGTCGAPTVTVADTSGVTATTLVATASGGFGGPIQYQWYTGGSCETGNEISGETGNVYTTLVSGTFSCKAYRLDPNTCANCDSAIATVNADTCSAAVLPYLENFDVGVTTPALPTCWSAEDRDANGQTWATSTLYYNSSPNAVRVYASTTGNDDWLFSRPLSLTGGTQYVLDYYRRAYSASYPESLEVKFGVARTGMMMVNTIFAADTFGNTTYARKIANFTPATTGTYYIGFHSMSEHSSSYGMWLDDIRVYQSGTCGAPDSVVVNSVVGSDSATLASAVYGGFGGPISYQWYTGEGCQTGNEISGETNSTYKTYVSGTFSCKAYFVDPVNCAGCDSAIATVVNCAAGFALPYASSFEDATPPALPACWNMENSDTLDPTWVTSVTYPRTGANCARITYNFNYPLNDWLFTPALQLTADSNYVLEYWYRAYDDYYTETMEIKIGMDDISSAMTTTIKPSFGFSTETYTLDTVSFTATATGLHHIGWHAISITNQYGIHIDDVIIHPAGGCGAPSVDVPAKTDTGRVVLTATASGGYGGRLEYQWFTGVDCVNGNQIPGANEATYTTYSSGVFSCRAWISDSVGCADCDSAIATVVPAPNGDNCDNPFTLTPPASHDSTVVPGTTVGFMPDCEEDCDGESSSRDVFYTLTLNNCRRIAMKLTGGDNYLSVYDGHGNCCVNALLCNDDHANFSPLPAWDIATQHPDTDSTHNSYVSADLEAGTYYIRVAFWGTAVGSYTLTVYDNGACCESPSKTTLFREPGLAYVWVHFKAVEPGYYVMFTSTNPTNDGDPRGGDPMFTAADTILVSDTTGMQVWTDSLAIVNYKNYVVLQQCIRRGRCCYGDIFTPTCVDSVTEEECTALTGTWTFGLNCVDDPCPVPQYCDASATSECGSWDEWISRVTVGTIDNATGCTVDPAYTDYTALSTNMTISTGYSITVENGNPYEDDTCAVWVDWNQDRDWDDAGELVLTVGGDGPYTGTIVPPVGASLGNTRMRVRIVYSTTPDPCGAESFGEIEDYTVNVQP